MDFIVYCVSLLPACPERMELLADHVESRRSPGRKNSASPSLLSGLFGVWLPRSVAGMGGTGLLSKILELFRFVTPGIYAIWMMLLARLRMLLAKLPLVLVDAASPMVFRKCIDFW